ncbi:MAG: site-specific integrase [Siculibacillus sp.]|nr:site-specific integrase [Siculibacillus sp.]
MAKVPGLSRRGSVWQFRVRVPEKLQKAIGKGEIVKSLGPVSHAEAARLARLERTTADRLFAEAEARARTAPLACLSESQLRHLTRAFFFRLEENAGPIPFSDDEREVLASSVRGDLAGITQTLEDASLQQVAIEFAEWANVRVERNSLAFLDLCRAVQRAHIEHYRREHDRLRLKHEERNDPLFADIDRMHPPKPMLTLGDAVEKFMGDPQRTALAPKTRALWTGRFGAWLDLVGKARPVAEITRDEVREALKVLMRVPKNAAKLYPGVPLKKVVKDATKGQPPLLSAKTVQLYIDVLNALFKFLVEEQLLPRNVMQNLKGAPASDDDKRRPWAVDELKKFFGTDPFDKPWYPGRAKSWLFWLPLLGLFTGAREGELTGLTGEDLLSIDDGWFLAIRPNDVRRLKTKQSQRLVPVHPALVRAGFLDFARGRQPKEMLFSDLPSTAMGPLHVVQKGLGRHIRQIVTDSTIVFHSFRHNFRDAAREAGLPLEVAGAIGGWKEGAKSSMAGYGKGYREKTLAEWMTKIEYPGLKLDHLTPPEPPALRVRYRQRPRMT